MSSSNRQISLSADERQRAKSRSSSRSHRTPSNTRVYDEDKQREKTSSQTSKRNTRETNSTKRSETSPSNRSTNRSSSKSNTSKKQRSNVKTPTTSSSSKSKSPSSNRKGGSKRKKNSISTNDTDNRQISQVNDSERQDLSSRGLSTVPTEILELVTLRRLILSNNNLSGLPTSIRALINLEYLDISRNPLRVKNGLDDYGCLPREFRYLRNLHTLIMSECSLKHIPVAVWNTVSLQTLDLSRNKIGYIVGEIGNLINLRHLRLSQMDLDTLPPELGFCEKLETIDLTSNPIDNLPETLVECRQLYEFKINYQTFYKLLDNYMIQLIDEGKIHSEHIPQVIFELEGLQMLDLNGTKLNSIPNQHTLFNLNELYLSNNSFFNIPESLCTMEKLKILDMSYNQLQTIPEYCIKIERLEILNLSYNNLTILPCHIARLSTLKNLIVNHNQINIIENGFSQNSSLLTLDISYNNLEIISNELCNLKELETLDLRYNQIEYLPLTIRHMIGLKSMNMIDENFQRIGLHLIGNPIKDPPSYIWKSVSIKILFDYIERKEKQLLDHFHHLKLILIGPKNIGKTTLTIKILNNHKIISNTQKTLDMYVSIIQENQLNLNEEKEAQKQKQKRLSDATSSVLTDQWIENLISTSIDNNLNCTLKIKRINPPPLKTYRSKEYFENFMYKSTLITKNNLYCTIFDITYEPSFEILYPLIYDSNALFILPVNLTILSNIIQAATSLENMNENENHITIIDYDSLLTEDWLYSHIFRYIESISDHCQQASIAIVGLIMNYQLGSNDHQQQLLDEIHSKVNMFLTDENNQRKNINLYSEYFSEPIYLDKEEISERFIEILEIIAEQWNIIHHKKKRQVLKQRLGFIQSDSLIIDYDTCLQRFQQENLSLSVLSNNEKNDLIEQEINQMTFDECLDYLKITGDILCFEQNSPKIILIKPYYLLNNILCRTIFRPHINEWLNYDDNMVFHFSGYYQTQELFNIDRQRLLTRGEYTWNMLNVLFYEQNINNNTNLIEQNIIDMCHLMEHLYLGYLNESNLNYREFTTPYFVCPWLMNEKIFDINYKDYFKLLEQKRSYENLQCEQKRRLKQYQIWLATDHEDGNILEKNAINSSQEDFQITIENLPTFDQIEIIDSQIINQDLIHIIKIINGNSYFLPNGLYERLLICLHPLFYERLDYYNLTLGRTRDKSLIKIERSDTQNQIYITINQCLLEHIQNILIHNLFSFYPTVNLRIET
ncbi:unnamed protein product [Rotaria sordida]|uniref:Uncharacterized protein n=1 Tax=Rotaria sordida TaxID=392033 RepID=A0A818WAQ6_9BILA|nr:unnamed protein product [Rotaria sordida]